SSFTPTARLWPCDVPLHAALPTSPLALIEVAAEPVVIDMPLSAALPVVTFRVPVSDPAVISPTNPVTTSAADPVRVSAVFCAREAAFTVTTSPAPLALIYVAADPV